MNTFKHHDFHDKTAKRKTHSCHWSSSCFPHSLENVSTNVNLGSRIEVTQKLCSSKIDESSVGQWIKVEEHDQCESLQFWSKFHSSNGHAFGWDLMINSLNVKNISHRSKSIIIWRDVHICWMIDVKDLCKTVRSDDEILSLNPTL